MAGWFGQKKNVYDPDENMPEGQTA